MYGFVFMLLGMGWRSDQQCTCLGFSNHQGSSKKNSNITFSTPSLLAWEAGVGMKEFICFQYVIVVCSLFWYKKTCLEMLVLVCLITWNMIRDHRTSLLKTYFLFIEVQLLDMYASVIYRAHNHCGTRSGKIQLGGKCTYYIDMLAVKEFGVGGGWYKNFHEPIMHNINNFIAHFQNF